MRNNFCNKCPYYGKQHKICEFNDCKPIEEVNICPRKEGNRKDK